MGIHFEAPLALLLLPPLVALVVLLHRASRRRLGVVRRRAALAVRLALLSFLVFALAGFQLVLPVDRLAVVYVVDLSDSVGTAGREEALAYLRESLAAREDGDVAGIVAFGGDALVERLPADLSEIDRIASTPVRGATDIGAALRLAGALFPDDAQKRIVLLSDGNDTTGSGQTEAALAAARGIQVQTHLTGLAGADEVLVERLTAPSTARLGERVQVSADLTSTVAQPSTARLYVNGELAATQPVDLVAGANRVDFLFTTRDAGFLRFRVVVEAARDTFNQNDRADANTIVKGEPRVLIVRGDEVVARQLVAALETERQAVDTVIPEAMPADLAGLADFDSIVLVDVPRLRLTDTQLTALQVYVRDLGRGLVTIGGPRAYGAGGYTDTPLEETLPVDMGVRDRTKQPDVALVVVIDKSGSMDACHCNSFNGGMGGGSGIAGVRKVDIGKEAILRAASALTARDEFGVVAFDEQSHWVIRTAPLGGINDVAGAISGIEPLGQTNIFSGLDSAVQALKSATATRRHIILLTDGWSSSGQYDDILAQMKAAGITLSTVGAGGGANPFLEQLARAGGGPLLRRHQPGLDPRHLPQGDTAGLRAADRGGGVLPDQDLELPDPARDRRRAAEPAGLQRHDRQAGGPDGARHGTGRPAPGPVAVRPRAGCRLDIGLHRALGRSWVGWRASRRFFSQMVGWTFPGEESGGIEAAFVDRGGRTYLRVESVNTDGSASRLLRDAGGAGGTGPRAHLAWTSSRWLRACTKPPLASLESGAYAVRVTQTKPGAAALGRTLGLVAPTAAEYRLLGANEPLLAAIRARRAERTRAAACAVWVHDLRTTSRYTDTWPWLLVLALLLWPLDIALRRVSVGRRELADARRSIMDRVGGRRVAARTVTSESMLAARGRAGAASARTAIVREAASGTEPETAIQARSDSTPPGTAPGAPSSPPEGPASAPPGPTVAVAPPSPPASTGDTVARLRDAKRRRRS